MLTIFRPKLPQEREPSLLERARMRLMAKNARQSRRTRIGFVVDATGSRNDTWAQAQRVQARMFRSVSRIGHLARFLGVTAGVAQFEGDEGNADQSSSVACVVNRYGPSNLLKSYDASVDAAEVLPLFLGGDRETARQRHVLASPFNWVTPAAQPTLLLRGTEVKYCGY